MNHNATKIWSEYFNDIGIDLFLQKRYLDFVKKCSEKDIPPIFEHIHLSKLFGRNPSDLMRMVFGTENYYREFKIKKRSGGFRAISAPYPSLLETQKWINTNILSKYNLKKCVTGYRTGKSIYDNAKIHCGRDTIVKIDIKDFFPSINFNRVMSVFLKFGYPNNVSFLLSSLCTLNNELPQGAATSPAISNIVCNRLDERFYRLCKKTKLRYTRYADDITISGKYIEKGILKLFFEIIEDEGFLLNKEKYRYLIKGDKKIITGLDVTSSSPRVLRKFRRELMKDVYFVWSAGLSTHVSRRKLFAPTYIEQLEGRLNFWKNIEPENPQMLKTYERIKKLKLIYSSEK